MSADGKNSDWVYVVVGKKGAQENYLGLLDDTTKVNFIPAFKTKEAAQDCFLTLPREKGQKYEVQAVLIEELNDQAADNGFVVAMVDKDGNIIK